MPNISDTEIDKFNLKFEKGLFIIQKGNDVSVFESDADDIIENYIILNSSVDEVKSFFSDLTREKNLISSSDDNCILEIGKPSGLLGKGYQIKSHQEVEFSKAIKSLHKKGLVVSINDNYELEKIPAQLNKHKNN